MPLDNIFIINSRKAYLKRRELLHNLQENVKKKRKENEAESSFDSIPYGSWSSECISNSSYNNWSTSSEQNYSKRS